MKPSKKDRKKYDIDFAGDLKFGLGMEDVNIKKLFSSDVIKAYKGVAEESQENKSDEEC
jgi:hypothetical protein